jgi:hypothetical protein
MDPLWLPLANGDSFAVVSVTFDIWQSLLYMSVYIMKKSILFKSPAGDPMTTLSAFVVRATPRVSDILEVFHGCRIRARVSNQRLGY